MLWWFDKSNRCQKVIINLFYLSSVPILASPYMWIHLLQFKQRKNRWSVYYNIRFVGKQPLCCWYHWDWELYWAFIDEVHQMVQRKPWEFRNNGDRNSSNVIIRCVRVSLYAIYVYWRAHCIFGSMESEKYPYEHHTIMDLDISERSTFSWCCLGKLICLWIDVWIHCCNIWIDCCFCCCFLDISCLIKSFKTNVFLLLFG